MAGSGGTDRLFGRPRAPSHAHFTYATARGRLDPQQRPVELGLVAQRRHLAETLVEQPADRVDVLALEGQVERVVYVVDRDCRIEDRLVRADLDDLGLLAVVLVL